MGTWSSSTESVRRRGVYGRTCDTAGTELRESERRTFPGGGKWSLVSDVAKGQLKLGHLTDSLAFATGMPLGFPTGAVSVE